MSEERFVVADKYGSMAQKYKWLWEQQRGEFALLQAQQNKLAAELAELRSDNKAAHHQLVMAQRERDTYAAALAQAHKVVAQYETLVDSLKIAP